ncbi:hypothetical protein ACLMJK_007691 [Lecanora helva]
MPSTAPRQVGFAPIPVTYSRLPHDDELYVMKRFARHASQCSTCAHPYDVHRKGGSLCSKGHSRALDVTQYVFNKAGQAFSVVDLDGNHRVQMEIPADCSVVRELLKALERGLRLRRKVQPISYDENYPIPPRIIHHGRNSPQPQEQREPRYIRTPTLETPLPPPSLVRTYSRRDRDRPTHFGRGSLYESDVKEARRQKEQRRQSTYYNVGSRGVLPVPEKDLYYDE